MRRSVPSIRFDATLYMIDNSTILRLPGDASESLPSRGQVAVQGTINGHKFRTVLEPDGSGGHWMKVEEELQHTAGSRAGDTARLEIEPTRDWPEPNVPRDLEAALAKAPQKIEEMWMDLTPMARWEWVRWVNATNNADTRERRIEVSISKMNSGKRRPCCFNLSACTDPQLARSGRLREPGEPEHSP
jgi:Domain of unknown function (DUF1905)/Bacteriocin-protection, YdeI or OmpD-Associated